MTDSDNHAYTTHDSTLVSLPWYVNGSLDEEERRMVDEHLAVCLTCRSELNTQQRIARTIQSRNTASVEVDAGFAQMRQRIQPKTRTLLSRVRDCSCSKLSAPAWAWASGIAVAASLFMAVPLLHDTVGPANTPGEFRTLSAVDGHLDFQENSLRLVFSAGLDDNTRRDILRSIHAVAVSPPSSRDVLTVQVPDGKLTAALALLRERTEVRLAEPVFNATGTAGSH